MAVRGHRKKIIHKHHVKRSRPSFKPEDPAVDVIPKEELPLPPASVQSSPVQPVQSIPIPLSITPVQPAVSSVSPPDTSQPYLNKSSIVDEHNNPPEIEEKKGHGFLIALLIVLIIGVLAGAGAYYYFANINGGKNLKQEKAPTQNPSPTQTATSTPTPKEIDLAKYSVKVLNGSGIKGEAAKAQGILEEEKFKVESIGNADSSSYSETIIKAKKTVEKEFIQKLQEVLEKSYKVGEVEDLSESEKVDVIVIIGSTPSASD